MSDSFLFLPHSLVIFWFICWSCKRIKDGCRNFVKELVILFHRTAAAPWGYVASIIKKELHWRFFLYFPLPPLLATGPFIAALDGKCIRYLLPPARSQERRTELKGTGHTAKLQKAFYLQTFTKPYNLHITNLTILYLTPLPYNFIW